jgi:glycosyltransferase involved in cell wall biosynthesis
MKILVLNRRDIANPAGGGAEVYTHEIARGLAGKYGCEVVVFSSRFRGSGAVDVIDGVRYLRRGNEVTVHLWGLAYAVKNKTLFDCIIDEFNGIGFFTFVLPNSVLLIHQLYKEFWFREFGIAGTIPYIVEPMLLGLYRRRPAITVSLSTKADLERRGFGNVRIVMNAVPHLQAVTAEKDAAPTLIFLGRLRSTKRPGDAIEIFSRVKERIPTARLWMIGTGPLEKALKKRANELVGVTFWDRVSEEDKYSLLRRAHVLIVPSVREGFGINVIEAASVGTPAVGYNVPGLRDSIRHCETGYLADSADEAAHRIVGLLTDDATYRRMSRNCLDYSKGFDWPKRVDEFWKIMSDLFCRKQGVAG